MWSVSVGWGGVGWGWGAAAKVRTLSGLGPCLGLYCGARGCAGVQVDPPRIVVDRAARPPPTARRVLSRCVCARRVCHGRVRTCMCVGCCTRVWTYVHVTARVPPSPPSLCRVGGLESVTLSVCAHGRWVARLGRCAPQRNFCNPAPGSALAAAGGCTCLRVVLREHPPMFLLGLMQHPGVVPPCVPCVRMSCALRVCARRGFAVFAARA
jgi:hypothetical protein